MPPKKNVKAPAEGKEASSRLTAAAAANSSNNTTSTTSSSITAAAATTTTAVAAVTVVAGCAPRVISNRILDCDAKGIPWCIAAMRENFNQALCRRSKEVQSTPEWQAANAADRRAMIQTARSRKEQEQDLGFDWREAARNMGFRAKGDSFIWKEGCPIYGTAGASDPAEEEEEEEELPFSLPDDEPTTKKRRREDEEGDEDDPDGDYTRLYMSRSIPRQTATAASVLSFLLALYKAAEKRNIWTCLVDFRELLQAQIKSFFHSYIMYTRAKTS
ncbi:hypothetical protein BPOR_0540g00050 [Botrytis porri]|uniref:Uncharacterized protein n=1 Tax=Botrytis porri TaxID=87229 RepID=A0A4Z1KIU9_9HELO|nr:hypothetical protein BPOR_0540g00050 [Botrytis porri]